MKDVIIILFFLMSEFVIAQTNGKVLYENESNDYSLLIENTTKIHKQNLADSNVETFVFTKNDQFKFTLTISRSKAKNVTNDSLSTPNYEEAYRSNCGCEVLSTRQSKVNYYSSIQFKIIRVEKGKTLLGYTDSFVFNETLFSVVFMTLESNFSIYQSEYSSIINSITVNP